MTYSVKKHTQTQKPKCSECYPKYNNCPRVKYEQECKPKTPTQREVDAEIAEFILKGSKLNFSVTHLSDNGIEV
jgi:hypothetical protein